MSNIATRNDVQQAADHMVRTLTIRFVMMFGFAGIVIGAVILAG